MSKRPSSRPRTGDDEWYSPSEIVEMARATMGSIDLDPASNETANRTVKATVFYDKTSDGLRQPWSGNVYLNPPWSVKAGKSAFIGRLIEHLLSGAVEQAVLVTTIDLSSNWGNPIRAHASALCLSTGPVKYHKGNDRARQAPNGNGSAISYFGPNMDRFADSCARFNIGMCWLPMVPRPDWPDGSL